MTEVLRTIALRGFDPAGEPSIREMADGSLEVWFEFMPPSDAPEVGSGEAGAFAAFDRELSAAAGVPVVWEDREVFRLPTAPPGTLERVRKFVEGYCGPDAPDSGA